MRARTRWTRQDLAQLDAQIVEILRADNPQSVRHVFYRCTDPRLAAPVQKDENGYRRVQRRVLALRRSGAVPYAWVTDATRTGYHVDTWTDPAEFLQDVAGLYRRDLWSDVETLVEVWCESRSIASVLRRDAERLAVSLYPTGGFSSASLVHAASEGIARALEHGGKTEVQIVFVADYDPAGMLIPGHVLEELRVHLGAGVVKMSRVAVTREQVEEYDLPTKPRKPSERRRPDVAATVEAEAMPAGILRQLVREAVEEHVPEGALEAARIAEEDEQNALFELARRV
ncbi:hypothetical protein [Candidatus Palauibacter sp.]|uniref:hypothetical protein n=1 Tax=Candidatus Palauibacter sp. TaxID=3101350 RepID=UPI003B018118